MKPQLKVPSQMVGCGLLQGHLHTLDIVWMPAQKMIDSVVFTKRSNRQSEIYVRTDF